MSINLEDYPYSASFLSTASVIKPSDEDCQVAKASLQSLSGLLPPDVTPEENPDLIYFAANGAVAGVCNENDDCLDPATALEVYHLSKNKYLNVDHKRDIVVGSVLYSGLSKYGENTLITKEEAAGQKYFNLSVVAIMWKAINKKLAEILSIAGDEDSSEFGKISLSWEVFFKGYDIAIGSPILSEARIITDLDEYKKLEPYLKRNGGRGEYQGQKVYRVIRNTETSKNVIIGGYSLVTNPAARVNGILGILSNPAYKLSDNDDEKDDDDNKNEYNEHEENNSSTSIIEENKEKDKNISENTSQLDKSLVIPIIAQIDTVTQSHSTLSIKHFMDIKKLEDITSNWSEFSKLEEAVASNKISEIWKTGIKEASEKFEAEIKAKETAVAQAQEQAQKALAEIETLKASFVTTSKELEEIKASQKAVADQEAYSGRLAQLEDEYELEDEDRQAIASEILGADDEAYAAFKKKFESFAKFKSKKYKEKMKEKIKAECMKEMQDKAKASTSTASTKTPEQLAEEALASASTSSFVPSAHVETQTSVLDLYANAFGKDNVKISHKTR
jgi:hypothetical protein